MEAVSVVKRGMTGTYTTTTVAGERVEAFVPHGLPPQPPLVMDGHLQMLLESATLAVGRLDGVSKLLPDKALFLYAFVRKEALVSSQIEGTQSSLSDLLLFEVTRCRAFRSTTFGRCRATSLHSITACRVCGRGSR